MIDIADAATALARGEPLEALQLVGRSAEPRAAMLRGIAYALMGDLELAESSLVKAIARSADELTRAHARAALVEVALGAGEVGRAARMARASAVELTSLGDLRNAAMQQLVSARAEVLLGRLKEAESQIDDVMGRASEPHVRAVGWLGRAEIAIRRFAALSANDALSRARRELMRAPNAVLDRAVHALQTELSRPIARLSRGGVIRAVDLFAIEEAARGDLVLVDGCRRSLSHGRVTVSLARRPVLFRLLMLVARAWPEPVSRDALASGAFEVRRVNASHRARLRVEVGRLRKLVAPLGTALVAAATGYAFTSPRELLLMLPPSDEFGAHVAVLLGDGAAWSAHSVAEHAGISRRTAQRALAALLAAGVVNATGSGKTRRYTHVGSPVASRMLLLGLVPSR